MTPLGVVPLNQLVKTAGVTVVDGDRIKLDGTIWRLWASALPR